MRRFGLPLLAALALAFASASVIRTQPERLAAEPPRVPPTHPYAHAIAAVGLVEPSSESIAIGTPLAGVVERVYVAAGDTVAAGAPLFTLDERQLRAALALREAALKAAEAGVKTAQVVAADARVQYGYVEKLPAAQAVSVEEISRRRAALEIAQARLDEARAEVERARAALAEARVELERATVRAPIAGQVLQARIHAGEYAAGPAALLVLGATRPLHVRVDIDEHEAWRLQPGRAAIAVLRGNGAGRAPLGFVRLEPLAVPKTALSGGAAERVDTRVVQAIYRIERADFAAHVGQQVDVFIEAAEGG